MKACATLCVGERRAGSLIHLSLTMEFSGRSFTVSMFLSVSVLSMLVQMGTKDNTRLNSLSLMWMLEASLLVNADLAEGVFDHLTASGFANSTIIPPLRSLVTALIRVGGPPASRVASKASCRCFTKASFDPAGVIRG